jgi:hypothetical protein
MDAASTQVRDHRAGAALLGAVDQERERAPGARRDLETADLPEERVEVLDPSMEARGAERIGFETSSRLGYPRGGICRVVVAVAVYKDPDAPPAALPGAPTTEVPPPRIVRAERPEELFRRGLLAPSMVAHLVCA